MNAKLAKPGLGWAVVFDARGACETPTDVPRLVVNLVGCINTGVMNVTTR